MKRAERRHHQEVLKKRAAKIIKGWMWVMEIVGGTKAKEPDKTFIGKIATTPKPCSCGMCGNPRKHFKEKTIQEKKHDGCSCTVCTCGK